MKEKNTNALDIENFVLKCKCNTNFKHGNNYFNSVKLYFEDIIDSDIIDLAKNYNFKYFVARCHVNSKLIYLFIYKIKTYEFN